MHRCFWKTSRAKNRVKLAFVTNNALPLTAVENVNIHMCTKYDVISTDNLEVNIAVLNNSMENKIIYFFEIFVVLMDCRNTDKIHHLSIFLTYSEKIILSFHRVYLAFSTLYNKTESARENLCPIKIPIGSFDRSLKKCHARER